MLKFIILALSLLGTSQAFADHVGPRYDWHYDGGYFHALGGSPTGWSETINGVESYQFIQTNRTDTYVELYDSSRRVYIRLFADRMTLKNPQDGSFGYFRAGHWDDRRLYSYQVSGGTAYFLLKPSEVWQWTRPGMANVYLRETLRNEAQIQLYNAREDYTFSLLDGELWFKPSGGQWAKVTDASWGL